MPDLTYFNYPYDQYVFTASQLKRVALAQQGCDAIPGYLSLSGPRYPPYLYGFGGAFFGTGCAVGCGNLPGPNYGAGYGHGYGGGCPLGGGCGHPH
jgi:hypothetical protein